MFNRHHPTKGFLMISLLLIWFLSISTVQAASCGPPPFHPSCHQDSCTDCNKCCGYYLQDAVNWCKQFCDDTFEECMLLPEVRFWNCESHCELMHCDYTDKSYSGSSENRCG